MKRLSLILALAVSLVVSYSCTEEETVKKVESVSINKSTLTLTIGDSFALKAVVKPSDADNKNISWKSSNAGVASVNTDGNVTAISVGTATITVTTEDGAKSATCEVTVKEKTYNVEGVTLDQETITLTEGETATLTATITPENATNKAVIWSTSDETVATVSEGTITAISAGTATITVKTYNGKYTTVKVKVVDPSDAAASEALLVDFRRSAYGPAARIMNEYFKECATPSPDRAKLAEIIGRAEVETSNDASISARVRAIAESLR
jgi:uncharacterized protein YjdB